MSQNIPRNKLKLSVDPEGDLLNDNDKGVDYLDYSVYSKALAGLLHRAKTPVTVGLFASWGSGKTFLLNQVKGQLMKYELQHEHDEYWRKFRLKHETLISCEINNKTVPKQTQTDGAGILNQRVDPEIKDVVKSHKRIALKRNCAFLAWTLVLTFTVLIILTTAIIVFHNETRNFVIQQTQLNNSLISSPAVISPRMLFVDRTPRNNQSKINSESSTKVILNDEDIEKSNYRLWLIVILIVLCACVFVVFCCCISNTDSRFWGHFRSNFRLVAYAAFTRFPRSASTVAGVICDDDIAMELDDSPDDILHHKQESFPTKYIFVNFRAWEYAGSDSLWAGIVTTLSDAVELHIGSVTARMFRLLHVEETSKRGNIKIIGKNNPKDRFTLYLKLGNLAELEDVRNVLKEYGVVAHCCRVKTNHRNCTWWCVRYSRPSEARFAEEALRTLEIHVQTFPPKCDEDYLNPSEETSFVDENGIHVQNDVTDLNNEDMWSDFTEENNCKCLCFGRFWSHFHNHPKTVCCRCPYLYMWLIFVIVCILFPILFCIFADKLELGIMNAPRLIPAEVQIISWIPAAIGVVVVVIRFSWAMCNSQTTRIKRSLEGTKGNMSAQLGFMNDVKKEVMIITKMIRCYRFTHKVNYKIVVSIDDLDRCPYDKVKSVLESVSILLSDRSSPFICIVAVDSRVAVKCIEQDMGEVLTKANVTGHEYLKKIINLPVCLPHISLDNARKFMRGMILEADETTIKYHKSTSQIKRNSIDNTFNPKNDFLEHEASGCCSASEEDEKHNSKEDETDAAEDTEFSHKQFLMFCRKRFQKDEFLSRCISGNPRAMKRIFNVLSFTTRVIKSKEEQRRRQQLLSEFSELKKKSPKQSCIIYGRSKQHARNLVRWIVLTEQWPYRISYLLGVMEHMGLYDDTLYDIYKNHVEKELQLKDIPDLRGMDMSPEIFEDLLKDSKYLTKSCVSNLLHITTNLDHSIKKEIQSNRNNIAHSTNPLDNCEDS